MKKYCIIVLLASVFFLSCKYEDKSRTNQNNTYISVSENSKNALDWSGTYVGMLPCADCEGLKTKIILEKNLTYTKTEQYLGVIRKNAVFEEKGSFIWDASGTIITLLSKDNERKYKVLENKILHLDNEGKEIESHFSKMYYLNKL
jgi:copper homeostasis protein (lipoprotein)